MGEQGVRICVANFWGLHGFDWLSEISEEESEELRSHCACHEYARADLIFAPELRPRSVYVLERGLARIYRLSDSGSEVTFGYVRPGEVLGELSVLSGRPRESFAQAVRPCLVWEMALAAFQRVLASQPGVLFAIAKLVGTRFKRIESRLENLVFQDLCSRLSHILLELAEDFGRAEGDSVTIDLALSQQDLAMLVGGTRQSVNECLRELREERLVEYANRRFTVLAPRELWRRLDPGRAELG